MTSYLSLFGGFIQSLLGDGTSPNFGNLLEEFLARTILEAVNFVTVSAVFANLLVLRFALR